MKKDCVKVFEAHPKPSKLFANAVDLQKSANLTSAVRALWATTVTAGHFFNILVTPFSKINLLTDE